MALSFIPDALAIVDCGLAAADHVRARTYACPVKRLPASFANTQYLDLGWDGAVRYIGQLQGLVDVDLNTGEATVISNNEQAQGLTDEQLVQEARQRLRRLFHRVLNVQRVFVVQTLFPTKFWQSAPGGLFPRQHSLPVQCVQASSAENLAHKLAGKTWDNYCG